MTNRNRSGSERAICPQCGSIGTHYWSDEGTHSLIADIPERRADIRCDFCGGSLQPVTLPSVHRLVRVGYTSIVALENIESITLPFTDLPEDKDA